jgi:predicted transcriptional regulator
MESNRSPRELALEVLRVLRQADGPVAESAIASQVGADQEQVKQLLSQMEGRGMVAPARGGTTGADYVLTDQGRHAAERMTGGDDG